MNYQLSNSNNPIVRNNLNNMDSSKVFKKLKFYDK